MTKVNTFRELIVWQKSMILVTEIYSLTKLLPSHEKYGLIFQIRRCSVSIPSNIAEGFGRRNPKEFIHFLRISIGSLFELQTQIEICCNLEYIESAKFNVIYEQSREIERLIIGLKNSITEKS
ncbi:MAG: four helix bundle protein [Candidatus Marinimicrobia bacterium]|nr:four helix bundle protein [Candidatus Neomarinimicrobiota bacterium]